MLHVTSYNLRLLLHTDKSLIVYLHVHKLRVSWNTRGKHTGHATHTTYRNTKEETTDDRPRTEDEYILI